MNKQQRLNELIAKAQGLNSKADRTPEEQAELSKALADATALKAEIESDNQNSNALAELNKFSNEPTNFVPKGVKYEGKGGSALVTEQPDGTETLEYDFGGLNEKQSKAIREPGYAKAFGRLLRGKEDVADLKALSEGLDTGGGYLVPPQMEAEILKRESAEPMLFDLVGKRTSSRSDKVVFPTRPYTGDDVKETPYGITYTGESGPVVGQPDKTFGEKEIQVFTGSFDVEFSADLLEDTGNALLAEIQSEANEAYNLGMEWMVTKGVGVGTPRGILSALATAGAIEVISIGSTINAAMMKQLILFGKELPKQYRAGAMHVMSDGVFHEFSAVLDSNNNLVNMFGRIDKNEGLVNALRPTFMGKPLETAPYMDEAGSNAILDIYGNFARAYYFVTRSGLTMTPYGEGDKEMLRANRRGVNFKFRNGGDVVRPWMLKAAKQA